MLTVENWRMTAQAKESIDSFILVCTALGEALHVLPDFSYCYF